MVNMDKYIVRRNEEKVGGHTQHDMYIEAKDGEEINFDSIKELYGHIVPKIDKKYDVDEIIQEVVKFKAIYWISKDDKVQEMKWSTFKKQLSIIRSK